MDDKFQAMIKELESKTKLANNVDLKNILTKISQLFQEKKAENENLVSVLNSYKTFDADIVKLNIGGKIFSTYKATLCKKIKKANSPNLFYDPHLLQTLVSNLPDASRDENQAIFIDRDPEHFPFILNYLRFIGSSDFIFKLPENTKKLEQLKRESEFYKLTSLYEAITENFLNKNLINSNILSNEKFEELTELCNLSSKKWYLVYRATTNGFGAKDFHLKCDNIPKTLTIIKTTNSCIFGGYTEATWTSKGGWKADANAFLFSLVNITNEPIVIKCAQPQYAIYCNSFYGPTFGGGHAIYVADNSNTNMMSHSNIGYSYKHNLSDLNDARNFLSGSYHFQTEEIEVYKRTHE